ncbi:hypothetical protein UlMin_028533 [Ulmus minor]
MAIGASSSANLIAILAILITVASAADSPPPTAYLNHTVGGNSGWFFNATTNTPATNYSSWAANQTFNLGDYLSKLNSHLDFLFPFGFRENSQTVIETTNKTTYQSCNFDDEADDAIQYSGGEEQFGKALTIVVPLINEGSVYYFSSAGDGVQCQRGLAFEITVSHGLGLPPILNQPPPPPYVAPPPGSISDQSPPVTVVQPSGNVGFRAGANLRWMVGLLGLLLLM